MDLRLDSPSLAHPLFRFLILSLFATTCLVGLEGRPAYGQAGKPDVLYYKSWAIIVAIDDYASAPKTQGAVAGGKAIAKVFREKGFEEVIELYDKKASFKQLRYILEDFLPRKAGPLDRVVFFFAGHSGLTKDVEGQDLGYLIPWDSKEGNVGRSLTLHQLKDLSKRIMSKHILFLLDTNISGWEVTPPQQLSLEGRLAPENEPEKRAVQLLTAAPKKEPLTRGEQTSAFIQALLDGLQGQSDGDGNGWIHASELGEFVTTKVKEQSKDRQHPEFVRLAGEGDMVLQEGAALVEAEPQTPEARLAKAQSLYHQALAVLKGQNASREALKHLNRAISYHQTFGDAYVVKAYILLDLIPNIEGALIAGLQAVQYAPKNPDSHFTLGLILERRQEYQDAERAYREALKVKPNYVDVYLSLGDLYARHLENPSKAVDAYEQYLAHGGNSNHAREYITKHPQKPKGTAP